MAANGTGNTLFPLPSDGAQANQNRSTQNFSGTNSSLHNFTTFTSLFANVTQSATNITTALYLENYTLLKHFSKWYQEIHVYVAIVICIFGVISNSMNIAVLSQKNMITSTNVILTALAVVNMLVLALYLPFVVYFFLITAPDWRYQHPYGWIFYLLFNTDCVITLHVMAMWLTVALVVFRYILVCHPHLGMRHCNL